METEELIEKLKQHTGRELTLAILLHEPGRIGSSACVGVNGVFEGIDWDNGKLFLQPDTPITHIYNPWIDARKRLPAGKNSRVDAVFVMRKNGKPVRHCNLFYEKENNHFVSENYIDFFPADKCVYWMHAPQLPAIQKEVNK